MRTTKKVQNDGKPIITGISSMLSSTATARQQVERIAIETNIMMNIIKTCIPLAE